jgi:hypothetical protein
LRAATLFVKAITMARKIGGVSLINLRHGPSTVKNTPILLEELTLIDSHAAATTAEQRASSRHTPSEYRNRASHSAELRRL